MKLTETFLRREIVGEILLIPIGESATRFNGILTVNELGGFLCELLQSEQTEESLLSAVLDAYDVTHEQARRDIAAFLAQLREAGFLSGEETPNSD